MENYNNQSYNNPPAYQAPQRGNENNLQQPVNPGYMQPYNTGQPSVIYNPGYSPVTENNLPEEFKPIGAWGYFGYNILFSIPLIGIIMLFVFSFGGTKNKNLRNYARSFFCGLIIYIIIIVFLYMTGILSSVLSGLQTR